MSAKEEIFIPLLGAVQASIAVLLTISYGVIAAQFNLLSQASAKDISKVCVRLFLPALLIVNVGSQLNQDTGIRYVPIVIWSILYNTLSIFIGLGLQKFMNLPQWIVPAIAFNNTTSLPLLLVQSLQATGILDSLDTSSDVVDRAKSYFLVNAMISNSLTFALGPRLLNGNEEDAPDEPEEKEQDDQQEDNDNAEDSAERGEANGDSIDRASLASDNSSVRDDIEAHEETSLLPDRAIKSQVRADHKFWKKFNYRWDQLPTWAQASLSFLYQFWNAPLIGAVIGVIVGLIPPVHTLLFSEQEEGGYLNAWLTKSVKNVGDLFASLQVVVVGVKLSKAIRFMKKGEDSGTVPWGPFVIVTIVRLIIWPLISVPLFYGLATKTNWLSDDPILWFCLMIMAAGPPAMKLTALADVSGAGEDEKMSIAKFLTVSYCVSPFISFAVVGALKASQAAVNNK
ncbi:hypothetical protein AAFC00_005506 [Neodothiora populina]|uniref:Membrane transporter n=1 Tax=Neodothiora populina TaxID=2781224 RepID=A0ABR3PL33_9PEZI